MRKIFVAAMKIGVASLASLVGWMIAGKILALSLGAVGIGLFGLLRQLLQNLNVLATLNGQNALVQGVSIRQEAARSQYVRSIFSLQLLFSGTVAAVLVLGAPWIGPRLLPHPSSPELIRWLALAVVALSFQTYFTGLLTGHQALDKLVRSQMLGPLTVVLLALPMSALLRGGHPVGFVVMLFIPSLVVGTYQARLCIAGGWLTWRGTRWLAWEDAQSFLTMSLTILVAGLVVTSVD